MRTQELISNKGSLRIAIFCFQNKDMEQKVAIYTRVSTQDQTTLNQRLRLEKFAQAQGWQYECSRKQNPVESPDLLKHNYSKC